MELGGSDAFIVLDDADMDTAVKWGVWGRMNNTRMNVVSPPNDSFSTRRSPIRSSSASKNELEKLVPGDPMNPNDDARAAVHRRGAGSRPEADQDRGRWRRAGIAGR